MLARFDMRLILYLKLSMLIRLFGLLNGGILTSLLPIKLFNLEVKLFNNPFNYDFNLSFIFHFPEMADNINHGSITILIKT